MLKPCLLIYYLFTAKVKGPYINLIQHSNELINFRLQYAQRLLNAGIERGHNPDLGNAKDWLRRTEKALADAKKDNDFIYHERIPEEKALTQVAKAAGSSLFCQ